MKYYGVAKCDIKGASNTKIYKIWHAMIQRCYDAKHLERMPHYEGSSVCEEWKKYSNFLKWAETRYKEGLHLDKDIKGNTKIYSPETCIFVPRWVNQFIVCRRKRENDLPEGAKACRRKFTAKYRHPEKGQIYIGIFDSAEAASEAYKKSKKEVIAEKEKELREIDADLPELILAKLEERWSHYETV